MRPDLGITLAAILSLGIGCSGGKDISDHRASGEPRGPDERGSATPSATPSARHPVSVTRPPPPPPLKFESTKALVSDAELARKVDDLASSKRMESSHIGAGGAPSEVHAKFVAVVKQASPKDLVALLRHESPIVRAYIADHLASQSDSLDAVVPLLWDDTKLESISGCMAGEDTVAHVTLESVCQNDSEKAASVLERVIAGSDTNAPQAIGCMPRVSMPAAETAILSVIEDESRAQPVREAAMRMFTVAPVARLCGKMRALASKEGDPMRQLAIAALSRCDDKESLEILEQATKSTVKSIASDAEIALLLHPSTPQERRTELAAVNERSQNAAYRLDARAGARTLDAGLLKVIEILATEYPVHFARSLYSVRDSPEATAMMRRIVSKFGVGSVVRPGALRYVARQKDPADLPELKKSLASTNWSEAQGAIDGIVAIKAPDARTDIEGVIATSKDQAIKKYAEDALKKL